MDQIVLILKALSDETRLMILIIISRRRICAKGIAKHLGITEAAVSQHLKVLKDTGIITGEKDGYSVYYKIQEQILSELVSFLELMKYDTSPDTCKWKVNMPNVCPAECKSAKNKCCHKAPHID